MFVPTDRWDAVYEKYQTIAEELLDVIFGSEEEARRLLGFTEDQVGSSTLWTSVLFRLATQRIDGFGLSPLGARKDEEVFQTLWPMASYPTGRYELISFDDPPLMSSFCCRYSIQGQLGF